MGLAHLKRLHRAELKGQLAATGGLKESDCPYVGRNNFVRQLREVWLRGFREAAKEHAEYRGAR